MLDLLRLASPQATPSFSLSGGHAICRPPRAWQRQQGSRHPTPWWTSQSKMWLVHDYGVVFCFLNDCGSSCFIGFTWSGYGFSRVGLKFKHKSITGALFSAAPQPNCRVVPQCTALQRACVEPVASIYIHIVQCVSVWRECPQCNYNLHLHNLVKVLTAPSLFMIDQIKCWPLQSMFHGKPHEMSALSP